MFGKRFTLFRLLGFEVKLDLTWLILALLVTWTLARGIFPLQVPELSTQTYWWMGAVGTLGLLMSIVFHELCHSLVARRYGLSIKGITLFIFGGVAEMDEEPPSPKAEFFMAFAGPLASLALAGALYLLYLQAALAPWNVAVIAVIFYLCYLNALLAVFNLIPAFPLDGGRMLRAALWGWRGNIRWATRIASSMGSGFGLGLILLAVLAVVTGNFIAGMWWFLIGMFIRAAAGTSYQRLLMQEALRGEQVARFMNQTPISVSPQLSIQELVDQYIYRHQFKMFPVVEKESARPTGYVSTTEVKEVPRDQWQERRVEDIVKPLSDDNTLAPQADALKALSLMTKTGNSRVLVVDRGKLVGLLALRDLMTFFSLKLELEHNQSPRIALSAPR